MKQLTTFLIAPCMMWGTGSVQAQQFQVFETTAVGSTIESGSHVFENNDLKLVYDFWGKGGRMTFSITNKSNTPIFIDWERSHLVYNGFAINYWDDKVRSASSYSSYSQGFGNATAEAFEMEGRTTASARSNTHGYRQSNSATVVTRERKVVNIPPNSTIMVQRDRLINAWLFDCDFNAKTTKKEGGRKRSYSKGNSPVVFRNYLAYATDEGFATPMSMDNEFYISSVEFVRSKNFKGKSIKTRTCKPTGMEATVTSREYPYRRPTSFYY